jgi:OmpA-like transmembrane domain.
MKSFLPAFAFVLMPFACAVQAADDYFGGLAVYSHADVLTPIAVSASFGAPTGLSDVGLLQDASPLHRIRIGYEYSPYLAVEGEYFRTGKLSALSANPAFQVGRSGASGFGLDAVGALPFWYRFSLLGKAGVRRVALDQDSLSTPVLANGALIQGKLGLGLQYNFSRSLGFRAEVERYRNLGPDRAIADTDGDVYSLGVMFRF